MIIIRGTDKFIIGCSHQIPEALYLTGYLVHIFLEGLPLPPGLLIQSSVHARPFRSERKPHNRPFFLNRAILSARTASYVFPDMGFA